MISNLFLYVKRAYIAIMKKFSICNLIYFFESKINSNLIILYIKIHIHTMLENIWYARNARFFCTVPIQNKNCPWRVICNKNLKMKDSDVSFLAVSKDEWLIRRILSFNRLRKIHGSFLETNCFHFRRKGPHSFVNIISTPTKSRRQMLMI